VTGFNGLGSVQAECLANQGLVISVGNSVGYPIQISKVNYTTALLSSYINTSVLISPGLSTTIFLAGVCPSSNGNMYSVQLSFKYSEPGQSISGPYFSSGAVSGTTSASGRRSKINITASAQTVTPFQQMLSFPGINYANYSTVSGSGISLANTFFTWPNMSVIPSWIESNNASVPTINGANSEFINTTSSSTLKPANAFTMTYWIYLRNFPTINHAFDLLINHGSSSGASGYFMDLYGTDLYLTFDNVATRYSFAINAPLDGLSLNQWVFLGGAYTAATGTCSIYINGVAYNNTCAAPGTTLEYNSSSYLVFGTGNSWANASIADVQFYNTTLSPAQVKSLYSKGMHAQPIISNKDNVGWWPMNGTLKDFSGNGNNGRGTGINMLNSTIWLKFNGGLPLGTTSIYMNFLPIQDNALNNENIGEAPTISSTYGQYDNGANVFNFYDNFAGTTLNLNLWNTTALGGRFSVDNGLLVQSPSGWNWIAPKSPFNCAMAGVTLQQISVSSGLPYISFYNLSTSGALGLISLSTPATFSTSNLCNANYPKFLIDTSNMAGSFVISSVFISAYPPNAVMPSVTFGAVQ
jgi:hypothetical protein